MESGHTANAKNAAVCWGSEGDWLDKCADVWLDKCADERLQARCVGHCCSPARVLHTATARHNRGARNPSTVRTRRAAPALLEGVGAHQRQCCCCCCCCKGHGRELPPRQPKSLFSFLKKKSLALAVLFEERAKGRFLAQSGHDVLRAAEVGGGERDSWCRPLEGEGGPGTLLPVRANMLARGAGRVLTRMCNAWPGTARHGRPLGCAQARTHERCPPLPPPPPTPPTPHTTTTTHTHHHHTHTPPPPPHTHHHHHHHPPTTPPPIHTPGTLGPCQGCTALR